MKFLKSAPVAAVLILAVPALAQTTTTPTYAQHGQTPNNSGSGAGPLDATKDNTPQVDSCRQLMQKAKSMAQPTNPDRADAAEKEMALAIDAREHGDYGACKMHVEQAMHYKM
jgi:hypothetical protein